ncbi:hypothetical protein ACFZDK_40165 [Streptomyces sp. NPDC007901]|uniref:hypothetical protein n=1 Tax=Streptomyces sp. NPDC007901 TaxID=3364785 RepID=UPI0036EDE32B
MPPVLTDASTVRCVHGGTLTARASQRALTVDGSPVLLPADLLAGQIIGCPVPCTRITVIAAGVSATLTVGGRPVMLATARGSTDAGTWQANDTGQTKLEAA